MQPIGSLRGMAARIIRRTITVSGICNGVGGYVSHMDGRDEVDKAERIAECVRRLMGGLAIEVSRIVMCCSQILRFQPQFLQAVVLVLDIRLRRFAEGRLVGKRSV